MQVTLTSTMLIIKCYLREPFTTEEESELVMLQAIIMTSFAMPPIPAMSPHCPAFRVSRNTRLTVVCAVALTCVIYSPVYTHYVTLSCFVMEHDPLASMH